VASDAAYVAGHSLGEYSALAAADSLSISDTARLLRIRGLAMQKAVPVGAGTMSAPFHCKLMQPAADAMAKALAEVAIAKPASPLVSNVLAAATTDPEEIR